MTSLTTKELLMWQVLKEKIADIEKHLLNFLETPIHNDEARVKIDKQIDKYYVDLNRLKKLFDAIDKRV